MNNQWDDIVNLSSDFDIRVETLISAFLSEAQDQDIDLNLDQIVVQPLGGHRRRIARDVQLIKHKLYNYDFKALLVQVNRRGLFDTLPLGLFLDRDKEYDTPIDRTKDIEEQIKNTRKFFLPYEHSMFIPRIEIEQQEQKLTEDFPKFVYDLWNLDRYQESLNDNQKFLLCYLLPEVYRTAGDWTLTGQCLEALLKKEVDLNFIEPLEYKLEDGVTPMNDMKLGENSYLGDRFRDDVPALEITVKNISKEELEEFLPFGRYQRLLDDLVYSYFIPIDVPLKTSIVVTKEACECELQESYLGYNLKLNEYSD